MLHKEEIELFRDLLNEHMPVGETFQGLPAEVLQMLEGVWPALDGTDESRMGVRKLSRAQFEECNWDPPVLTLAVERHGATVNGSIYGEIQGWRINLDQMTAKPFKIRNRRLRPAAAKVDLKPLATRFV